MRAGIWGGAALFAVVGVAVVVPRVAMRGGPTPPKSLAANPCPTDRLGQQVRSPSTYTNKAPAYTGPVPHSVHPHSVQVIAVSAPDASGAREANEIQSAPDVPGDWQASDGASDAQLVLCRFLTEGASVKRCSFANDQGTAGTTTLVKAAYTYQLYEARTARLLKRFQLAGTEDCPYSLSVKAGVLPKTVPRGIDDRKVADVIRSFVQRPS